MTSQWVCIFPQLTLIKQTVGADADVRSWLCIQLANKSQTIHCFYKRVPLPNIIWWSQLWISLHIQSQLWILLHSMRPACFSTDSRVRVWYNCIIIFIVGFRELPKSRKGIGCYPLHHDIKPYSFYARYSQFYNQNIASTNYGNNKCYMTEYLITTC